MRTKLTNVALSFLLVASCFCQGPPASSPLFKKPLARSETVLAGVDLYNTKTERAVEILGKPTRVTEVKGTEQFEWGTVTCQLTLVAHGSWIASIDVRGGEQNCKYGHTGHGLRLGASIADTEHIYPPSIYTPSFIPFIRPGYPLDCQVHPTLDIEINAAGRINRMTLSDGTICY